MEFIDFVLAAGSLFPVVVVAAPLISTLTDIGKRVGVVPDGSAQVASVVLNVLAWAGLWFAQRAGVEAQFGQVLEAINSIAVVFLPFLVSLFGTKLAHQWLGWLDLAFSHGPAAPKRPTA